MLADASLNLLPPRRLQPVLFFNLFLKLSKYTLDITIPRSSALQVAANQLVLAPMVLTTVFAWNLSLSNKMAQIPDKIKDDLWPTMMNG